MANYALFKKLTEHLGLESDCPLCGQSWPNCNGMCVAHTTMNGKPGPYHEEFNDDCARCHPRHWRIREKQVDASIGTDKVIAENLTEKEADEILDRLYSPSTTWWKERVS